MLSKIFCYENDTFHLLLVIIMYRTPLNTNLFHVQVFLSNKKPDIVNKIQLLY